MMSTSPSVPDSASRAKHVLLCVSGSVASVRGPALAVEMRALGLDVRVVATERARHFLPTDWGGSMSNETNGNAPAPQFVYTDAKEWGSWNALGDTVLHIELRRWADVLVIAPASANTLAKVAGGLADNLVTCVARAWPWGDKPVVIAPAMNTAMWTHPVTPEHLERVERYGARIVPPVAKVLACGDHGVGAMESPANIARVVSDVLTSTNGVT